MGGGEEKGEGPELVWGSFRVHPQDPARVDETPAGKALARTIAIDQEEINLLPSGRFPLSHSHDLTHNPTEYSTHPLL